MTEINKIFGDHFLIPIEDIQNRLDDLNAEKAQLKEHESRMAGDSRLGDMDAHFRGKAVAARINEIERIFGPVTDE